MPKPPVTGYKLFLFTVVCVVCFPARNRQLEMNLRTASILSAAFLLFLYLSCERPPEVPGPESMRPVPLVPAMDDDLFPEGLKESIGASVEKLSQKKGSQLVFGQKTISAGDYVLALNYLLGRLEAGVTKDEFIKDVRENFDFYGFPGKPWGRVFITSYFSPVLSASRTRTPEHTQALYRIPDDLVRLGIDRFVKRFERLSFLEEDKIALGKLQSLYGRVNPGSPGGMAELVPYYSRSEIDSGGRLRGKKLEIAWVDPVDAFFLQIQGSGKIRFADGEERVIGYAAQNGHDYVAIGKFLFEWIPREKMSMWAIESHLRSLSYAERMKVLYKNPSYIFFRRLPGKPQTAFGTEVIDGRTIATDKAFFPRGSLAFMEFERPVFETPSSVEPSQWKPVSRFVINHDSGGAIKGARRADLFWGEGKDASRHAGVMKNWGKFFYLVPKGEFLTALREKNSKQGTGG